MTPPIIMTFIVHAAANDPDFLPPVIVAAA